MPRNIGNINKDTVQRYEDAIRAVMHNPGRWTVTEWRDHFNISSGLGTEALRSKLFVKKERGAIHCTLQRLHTSTVTDLIAAMNSRKREDKEHVRSQHQVELRLPPAVEPVKAPQREPVQHMAAPVMMMEAQPNVGLIRRLWRRIW